jgi:hypothetical protein
MVFALRWQLLALCHSLLATGSVQLNDSITFNSSWHTPVLTGIYYSQLVVVDQTGVYLQQTTCSRLELMVELTWRSIWPTPSNTRAIVDVRQYRLSIFNPSQKSLTVIHGANAENATTVIADLLEPTAALLNSNSQYLLLADTQGTNVAVTVFRPYLDNSLKIYFHMPLTRPLGITAIYDIAIAESNEMFIVCNAPTAGQQVLRFVYIDASWIFHTQLDISLAIGAQRPMLSWLQPGALHVHLSNQTVAAISVSTFDYHVTMTDRQSMVWIIDPELLLAQSSGGTVLEVYRSADDQWTGRASITCPEKVQQAVRDGTNVYLQFYQDKRVVAVPIASLKSLTSTPSTSAHSSQQPVTSLTPMRPRLPSSKHPRLTAAWISTCFGLGSVLLVTVFIVLYRHYVHHKYRRHYQATIQVLCPLLLLLGANAEVDVRTAGTGNE